MSSVLVLDGDPGVVLAVVDPLSELHDAVLATGSAVLNLLGWQHHALAEAFGFQAPAPGGPFRLAEWTASRWGPALSDAAGLGRLPADRPAAGTGRLGACCCGWRSSRCSSAADGDPLLHHRGRYRRV